MIEQTRQLLLDVVPLVEGASALLRLGDDAWVLVYNDDKTTVEIRADRQLSKLVLCMSVGTPTAELRAPTWHAAMVFNGLYRETNGQRFSLDEPQGGLQLLVDLGIQGVEVNELVEIIGAFVQRGRTWAELIAVNGGLTEQDSALVADAEVGVGNFV